MQTKLLAKNAAYQRQVEALFGEISSCSDAALNQRPPGGSWSVIQVMHHLIISEEQSLRYVQKKLSFNPKLNNAGLMEWLRARTLWFYLNVPIKFKAPPMVGDENLPEFVSLDDTRARWLTIRKEWADYLEKMPAEVVGKAVYRHPIVGRLGWSGMFTFFTTHFNRHLKQIRRTLRQTA